MSSASVLVLKTYAEHMRRNAAMRQMEEEMGEQEEQEEFPLDGHRADQMDSEEDWDLEDDPEDDTSQPPRSTDMRTRGGPYRDWQDRLQQRGRELGATAERPDVDMPTTVRGLGSMRRPIATHMGVDSDIPLPEEMGRIKRPLMRSEAFDYAMQMLENRYFG